MDEANLQLAAGVQVEGTRACGWIVKQGYRVKNWKKRWFVLEGKTISYFQEQNDGTPKGMIFLGAHLAKKSDPISKFKHVFRLITRKRTYYIVTADENTMNRWIELINALIEESVPDPEDAKRSKMIDKQLHEDVLKSSREVKLLLLGTGESGKSTIFKQMKILQVNGGYSQEELLVFKPTIYQNCITQMKVLINAAAKLGIELVNEGNKERATALLQVPSSGEAWRLEIGEMVEALWADPGAREAFEHRDKHFHLNDTAQYFFDNIARYCDESFVPRYDDILRARVRSTGIEEATFKFEDLEFRMVDVGGQRSERKKWIHCFDVVTAVLFCVGLSEYDQTLREDETQNRMKESLLLFDEISNMSWFKDTTFILFLNKVDLFKEKIHRVDLSVCFPEYKGGANYDLATSFVKERFLEQNKAPHLIYTHFTCAINTENIAFVWKVCRENIIREIISGIF